MVSRINLYPPEPGPIAGRLKDEHRIKENAVRRRALALVSNGRKNSSFNKKREMNSLAAGRFQFITRGTPLYQL
jgi:hypothetical protein